jgi:hypothetical protein
VWVAYRAASEVRWKAFWNDWKSVKDKSVEERRKIARKRLKNKKGKTKSVCIVSGALSSFKIKRTVRAVLVVIFSRERGRGIECFLYNGRLTILRRN